MAQNPVAAYRAAKNLTQEQLAELVGVQKAAVSKWEKKQVSARKVRRVEEITGISRHDLRPDVFGPAPGGR